MHRYWLTVVLVLGTAGQLWAQEPEFPAPGARLRISLLAERLIGTLVEATDEEMVVHVDHSEQMARIPRGVVTRVELSRGQRSRQGRGAVLGLLIGGGGLALVAWAVTSPDDEISPGGAAGYGLVVGVLPGFLLGAMIGGMVRTDDWAEVPLSNIRISASPAGGVGVGVTVPTP
jgi:hypothetical protein